MILFDFPHVDDESQFSHKQLWLMSDAGDKLNTIEVGWHVNILHFQIVHLY